MGQGSGRVVAARSSTTALGGARRGRRAGRGPSGGGHHCRTKEHGSRRGWSWLFRGRKWQGAGAWLSLGLSVEEEGAGSSRGCGEAPRLGRAGEPRGWSRVSVFLRLVARVLPRCAGWGSRLLFTVLSHVPGKRWNGAVRLAIPLFLSGGHGEPVRCRGGLLTGTEEVPFGSCVLTRREQYAARTTAHTHRH